MIFDNRLQAGRYLATKLNRYAHRGDVVVLGLPRGGVPVAYEIAVALHAPLDVFMVRKLGVPGHEELAMGAVAGGGIRVLNQDVVDELQIPPHVIDRAAEAERNELQRREAAYRGERPPLDVFDRIVIVVDDGLATGATMRAALQALRQLQPKRLIAAAPVGADSTCHELDAWADETVCAMTPDPFYAVGSWYHDFEQTTDEEVKQLLDDAAAKQQPSQAGGQLSSTGNAHAAASSDDRDDGAPREETVRLLIDDGILEGTLSVPPSPRGIIVFAHGSGSSRHSPRNRFVAEALNRRGFATLLFDLLTAAEERLDERTGHLRFDIDFLSRRLLAVTDALVDYVDVRNLPIGYFGASTGAAAALTAAAQRPQVVAVVSRGGRPDLAADSLRQVYAAVLLIVGGRDEQVLELNRRALVRLSHTQARELSVIPGATHLFEEPGSLDAVARLAADWFAERLVPSRATR